MGVTYGSTITFVCWNGFDHESGQVPNVVSNRPLRSILVISDFTGASFDKGAREAMEESAAFDKPYVKKSGNPHGLDRRTSHHGSLKA